MRCCLTWLLAYARSCILLLSSGATQRSTALKTPVLSLASSLQRFAMHLFRRSDALSIKTRCRSVTFSRSGSTRLPNSTSPSLHCTFRFLGPTPRTHHLLSNLRKLNKYYLETESLHERVVKYGAFSKVHLARGHRRVCPQTEEGHLHNPSPCRVSTHHSPKGG